MVLRHIRRARRETGETDSVGQFRDYRPTYRTILVAAREAGGEDALDDIMDWAVEWTKQEGRLPEPDEMRQRAREVLDTRGVELPDGSPLEAT